MEAVASMKASVEAMRREVARLTDEIRNRERIRYRVESEIHAAEGRTLEAAFCLAMADNDKAGADEAWLTLMAEGYLRHGKHVASLLSPDRVEERRRIELRAAEMAKEARHA